MNKVMSSALLVVLFAPAAWDVYAQDVSFQPAVDYFAGFGLWSVAVGDFNGDGILDLAVANLTNGFVGRVSVLLGNGDGTFQTAVNFEAGGGPRSVAVGDFTAMGSSTWRWATRFQAVPRC
jgi:hypothetical protein